MDNFSDYEKEDASMLHPNECIECRHQTSKPAWNFKFFVCSILVPILTATTVFTILMISPLTASWLRPGIDVNTFHPTTKHLGFLPSSDALEFYDLQPTPDAWITSEYSGPPTEAKGLAWDKLQAVRGLRVSRTEGAQINLPGGLRLENGDHATITGVMHNLHCLRMIRQYLYPDYYYANASETRMEYLRNHADHCIETLRESTTCLPDLTPHALQWAFDDERIHVSLKAVVKRQCVNWGSLVHWQKQREYNLDDLWEINP